MTTSTTTYALQVRGGKLGPKWETYGLAGHDTPEEAEACFAEAKERFECDEWQVFEHHAEYTSTIVASSNDK